MRLLRTIVVFAGYGRVLGVLAIAISIPIWIATAVGLVALYGLLGRPTGTAGAVLGVGYLVASIALTALAIRWLVRRLRPWTSAVESLASGSDDEEAEPLPNQADVILTLPPGWKLGLSPEAAREAKEYVHGASVIGYAYDASRADTEYQTSLVVRFFPPYPDQPQDADARLRWFEDNVGGGEIVALDKILLPVGEAVRLETRYQADGTGHPICAVRYAWEVPGGAGSVGLEFSCEEQLLPLYRSEFDAIARTLSDPSQARSDRDAGARAT